MGITEQDIVDACQRLPAPPQRQRCSRQEGQVPVASSWTPRAAEPIAPTPYALPAVVGTAQQLLVVRLQGASLTDRRMTACMAGLVVRRLTPYVAVFFCGQDGTKRQAWKSEKHKRGHVAPIWNEVPVLPLQAGEHLAQFTVYNRKPGYSSDGFVGSAQVALASIAGEGQTGGFFCDLSCTCRMLRMAHQHWAHCFFQ